MKKNQLIIGGSILCVILLFFVLIYRSSGGKSYEGDSQISIRVETGISLPKVYLDSLLMLVDLYQKDGIAFMQSSVSVFTSAVDSQSIQCPVSGMNQFRSKFSGGFYTFTARQADLRTMRSNAAQFVGAFSNTCPLPDKNANIMVHCDRDSSGMFKAVWSVATIKSLVTQALKTSRFVKIYFTTGEGKVPIEPGGQVGNGPGGGGSGGGGSGGNGPGGGGSGGDDPGSCTSESVKTELSLIKGAPNTFSWIPQEGFTYDFSLSCADGNCAKALSVNETDVQGGKYDQYASYDEATEISYLATLTVRCNGKTVKKIQKYFTIRCG
ncbi:MAG: hypothetical protein ACKO4Y_01465 [Flavobacteriales bacterium]